MQALGVIAATLLLATSVAQAEEDNGKKLVEQLFADCDAVLADPAHVLEIGDIYGGAPAAATVDGKILTVSVPVDGNQTALQGIRLFHVAVLPGGVSAQCTLTLFGGDFSQETGQQISQDASIRGQALVGEDALQTGGPVGGPALLAPEKLGDAQIRMWASPDFPPRTTVTLGASDQFINIAIQRFRAAP